MMHSLPSMVKHVTCNWSKHPTEEVEMVIVGLIKEESSYVLPTSSMV